MLSHRHRRMRRHSCPCPLAGEEIDELIQLGEIGHFRRILEKLNEIENTAPECRDFVARIRGIVDAFDFKRYATVLQEIRGTHA